MLIDYPRAKATINGVDVFGIVDLVVNMAGYFSANRFKAVFAIGQNPLSSFQFFSLIGEQNIVIDVMVADAGYQTVIEGKIDNVRMDVLRNVVIISGRDMAAYLIDAEVSETYVNQSASQIAQAIADRHGFSSVVSSTTDLVGQYYEIDHAKSVLCVNSKGITEWSLLSSLALMEGFVLFVSGKELYFGPPQSFENIDVRVNDFEEIILDVATSLPASLTVKSWLPKSKSVVTASAGDGNYSTIVRPNLTTSKAQSLANNCLDISKQHSILLVGKIRGNLNIVPGSGIALCGTNSEFDKTFAVKSIRKILSKDGYYQTIQAYA